MNRFLRGVQGLSQQQELLEHETSHREGSTPLTGLICHPPHQHHPFLPSCHHLTLTFLPLPTCSHCWLSLTCILDVFQVRNEVTVISVFSVIFDLWEKHRAGNLSGEETSGTQLLGVLADWAAREGWEVATSMPQLCWGHIWLFFATSCLGSPVSSGKTRSEALWQLPGKGASW